MKHYLALGALLSTTAFANLHLAPPDFDTTYGRAVFVDFTSAQYDVTYDLDREVTTVKTKITFTSTKKGKPLFDLVPEPSSVKIDGHSIKQYTISFPGNLSNLRQLSAAVEPGDHTLEMVNEFSTNVSYDREAQRVSSAFWIRDLKDRLFLEQYVPSNFEYDQYKMTMNINFLGVNKADPDIYANGVVSRTSSTSFKIEFPEYFTASCPFYHVTPKNDQKRLDFTYKSISGREFPVTVYSGNKNRTKRFKDEAIRVLKELEGDYGPYAHPSFIAYGTGDGTGGMEHSGATATAFKSLDHELLHSYFAKGIMPANGNSGWIDEAIASWRDKGYQRNATTGFGGSDLGGQSVYKRNTDNRAYALGAAFMAYVDWRLQNNGGLKAFLKGYFQTYKHQVITSEHLKNNLEFFSGLDFDQDFGTYIWGSNSKDSYHLHEVNPHHKALSEEQLMNLL